MRQRMKDLLEYCILNNYSTEDVITIMDGLKRFGKARVSFKQSTTPESVALARWALDDARKEWHHTCRDYNLPMSEPDWLY